MTNYPFLNGIEEIWHPSHCIKLMKFQVPPLEMETLAAMNRQTEILSELLQKVHKIDKITSIRNLQSSVGNLHP
jgi:uncharacterized protein YoxC